MNGGHNNTVSGCNASQNLHGIVSGVTGHHTGFELGGPESPVLTIVNNAANGNAPSAAA